MKIYLFCNSKFVLSTISLDCCLFVNAYVIVLCLTCDSPRIALKLTMGAWKPANTNPSDKIYVCMLDMAVQRANSMVSFYDSFQKYKLRHWRKNAQRAVNDFIDYMKRLLQPTITISFVNAKLTFKLLSNTMSVFHGVKNDSIFKYRKTLRRISSKLRNIFHVFMRRKFRQKCGPSHEEIRKWCLHQIWRDKCSFTIQTYKHVVIIYKFSICEIFTPVQSFWQP